MVAIGINVSDRDEVHGWEAITPNKPRWSDRIISWQEHVDVLRKLWDRAEDEFEYRQDTRHMELAGTYRCEYERALNRLATMKDEELTAAHEAELQDSVDDYMDENSLRHGG